MKKIVSILLLCFMFLQCSPTKTNTEQPVKILNEKLEYEVIIFDIGFNSYLNSIAKPIDYYSENFYELKNRRYITVWNQRVGNPSFNQNIYENRIDYDFNIHYGLEVNYKLYNYFKFVEYKYKQNF